MAIEKRPIHRCACRSSKTNKNGTWTCDRAGKACPVNGIPQTRDPTSLEIQALEEQGVKMGKGSSQPSEATLVPA